VIVSDCEPIKRHNGEIIPVGPEYVIPIIIEKKVLGVLSILNKPYKKYNKRDFF